ncbi:MAG TPA: CPXCG motif-containing cysteine-rich protein [Rhodanobacteraceae bacterium]|nr:CPXCG motif-containing cysteine-rich protein [Rhodanobacteraceae bacterium]
MLEFVTITCPYCGESFDTSVDASTGSTRYVEDCQVCCKPIEFHVRVDAEDVIEVSVRRMDE